MQRGEEMKQSDIDKADMQAADNVIKLALLREKELRNELAELQADYETMKAIVIEKNAAILALKNNKGVSELLAVAKAAAEYVHSADDATLGVLCHEVAEWEAGLVHSTNPTSDQQLPQAV